MTAPDPEPPRPPGTPEVDLDVPVERADDAEATEDEDVEPVAGAVEPLESPG